MITETDSKIHLADIMAPHVVLAIVEHSSLAVACREVSDALNRSGVQFEHAIFRKDKPQHQWILYREAPTTRRGYLPLLTLTHVPQYPDAHILIATAISSEHDMLGKLGQRMKSCLFGSEQYTPPIGRGRVRIDHDGIHFVCGGCEKQHTEHLVVTTKYAATNIFEFGWRYHHPVFGWECPECLLKRQVFVVMERDPWDLDPNY